MARSIARQAAMQLLYALLSGGESDDQSLAMVYEQLSLAQEGTTTSLVPDQDDSGYIQDVLDGVARYERELDETIDEHSRGDWALERIPHVDLSILRLSAYELFYRPDIPDNVAISQAMELAETYSEPKSSRYINGVLGAIGRSKQKG